MANIATSRSALLFVPFGSQLCPVALQFEVLEQLRRVVNANVRVIGRLIRKWWLPIGVWPESRRSVSFGVRDLTRDGLFARWVPMLIVARSGGFIVIPFPFTRGLEFPSTTSPARLRSGEISGKD